MKQKLISVAVEWWPDVLLVVGAAAISYGAGLVYVPAGWIVAGAFGIAAGVLGSRR